MLVVAVLDGSVAHASSQKLVPPDAFSVPVGGEEVLGGLMAPGVCQHR